MPTLVKLSAAASTIGVTPQTLRQYLRLGRLREVRFGNRIFIEEAELCRFIEAGRRSPAGTSTVEAGGTR